MKNYITRLLIFFLFGLSAIMLFSTQSIYALSNFDICIASNGGYACASRPGAPKFVNPLRAGQNVPELAGNIIRMVLGIIGTIALIIFIYGGFVWMTSMGEEDRIKRGRETMIWAGIGLIVIFGAYTIVEFIISRLLS